MIASAFEPTARQIPLTLTTAIEQILRRSAMPIVFSRHCTTTLL